MRGTDESALVTGSALLDAFLELLFGEQVLNLGLSTLGLHGYGNTYAYFASLSRVQYGNARHLEVDQVIYYGINRVIGPIWQTKHDLVCGSNDRDLALLGICKNVAEDALLVNHDAVHDTGADHLSPPAHSSSDLGLGSYALGHLQLAISETDPVQVMSGTANAANVHLVPEIVVLGIDHGFSASSQVVAVSDENALVLVQGSHAYLNERSICSTAWHVVGHDLQHIADLHAQQVQHAGM